LPPFADEALVETPSAFNPNRFSTLHGAVSLLREKMSAILESHVAGLNDRHRSFPAVARRFLLTVFPQEEAMNPSESEMNSAGGCSRKIRLGLVAVTLMACAALPALAASGAFIARNTPNYTRTAKNLGTVDPKSTIDVSLWLNPHNRAAMDTLAASLYDRTSPNYRHFLNRSQIAARFAPTAAEAKTVREFLEAHNLRVTQIGPDNFFVHARGTVGDIEAAFHVQLNIYSVHGKTLRANDRDPYIDGEAGPLVRAISGLDSGEYEHPVMSRTSKLGTDTSATKTALAAAAAKPAQASDFYTNDCFDTVETDVFSTNNDGEFPIGTYKGTHLNLQSLTSPGCGYTPPEIQTAYTLTGLYAEGFDGTGQTIGIIDWCGSLTIQNDANVFSAMFGLPALTSSNFAITYIPVVSTCQAAGQVEINLDVEWSHAVAPGANINLIVPPSPSFTDVDEAEFTAVTYGLASVISGSYGAPESFTATSVLETENLISETAAISGISTNFASGDDGDYTVFGVPPTVNAPADSPWATAVGGISLALNSDNSIAWQAGWGNNQTLLAEEGLIADPPAEAAFGFSGGAGGGVSNCVTVDSNFNCLAGFAKPSFQKHLPGKNRLVPDVGWLADPFTGAVIAISVPGQIPEQVWLVVGGTSLATPMFSALWAIANQEAGAPLGFAAPYLYSLPAGAITDIVPVTAKNNVKASIKESPTVTDNYTASQVLGGATPAKFISAIWDFPSQQDTALAVSFGTDCDATGLFATPCNSFDSLHTKIGWDNVTGVGVPNGQAFADAFAAPAAAVKK
jgi:subtilase family serine protease